MEGAAQYSLEMAGFPVFFPLHAERINSRETRVGPLFPRYGFVQPDENGQWIAILSRRGVSNLIRRPDTLPARVPLDFIDRLMKNTDETHTYRDPPPPEIEADDTVKINEGSWIGHVGICTRAARDRIWVLLTVLGASREVSIPREIAVAA